MKIFECQKENHNCIVKIFGMNVYEVKVEQFYREQSFLGNLLTTQKNYSEKSSDTVKDIFFLGKNIWQESWQSNTFTCKLFNKKVYSKTKLDKILYQLSKKYDLAIVMQANSGEICLFLTYLLDALIQKTKSKNVILVATKKYHCDIAKMLAPEITCIYHPLKYELFEKEYQIGSMKCLTLFPIHYFIDVEKNIATNPQNTHYFTSMKKYLGLDFSALKNREITRNESTQNSMLEKVKKIDLDLEKFVIVAPEAISCEELSSNFWHKVLNDYKNQGYDIFVNLVGNNFCEGIEYKKCGLTFAELYELALLAKEIVCLRSGLVEFLMHTKTPIRVLYTAFKDRGFFPRLEAAKIFEGFRLRDFKEFKGREEIVGV